MSDAAAGVFISYRRHEASWLAAWLHDRLVAQFGDARVFLDIDWIKPGVDFMQVITEAIARSRVLLVIIGPRWLAAEGEGSRRLDRPDDPVGVELETAFRRGLRVIPLLLDGATMPQVGDLPDALAGLARLNALKLAYQSARSDLARLAEALADELGIIAPTSGLPTVESVVGLGPESLPRRSVDWAAPVHAGRDAEQRGRLLGRLSRTYTEYLDQSVVHDAILELQLELDWLPGRIFRPQDRLLPVLQRPAERLPAGTPLLQAFNRAGGLDGDGLLVLGEPGAGKTTLLFELGRCLAARAQTDPRHPVPVYLPLSSWATHRPPLDEWVVEQLNELYQIPRPLGRRWTAGTQLLFVLDGLDEIPDRSDRIACVKAINQFSRFGRSARLPVVVASRPTEYDTLPVKLQLEAAIGVRPLDLTVVLDGLEHAPGMQAVVAAVRHDPELLELLRSPLLVSMLTLTYAGVPQEQIRAITGTPAQRRQQLITDYVNRRFELDQIANCSSERRREPYPPERTRAWLSALALYLIHRNQSDPRLTCGVSVLVSAV
jgi:TIR domain/NACHT domain